jgi:tetratricopeptide (TPR) repeat protein
VYISVSSRTRLVAVAGLVFALAVAVAFGQPARPTAIQAKRFAVGVRLANDSPLATQLTLWYTRDKGQTWHHGPGARAGEQRVVFDAPGEGLYGFYFTAQAATGAEIAPPGRGATPQRWVYVDYTPPLAQWKYIDVITDAQGERRVAMDWVAYDANFDARPIAIEYQRAGQSAWQSIDDAVPNSGQYDWRPPDDLTGRVTFKLTTCDLGGHRVERLFGPLSLDMPRVVSQTRPHAPATQPALDELVAGPPAPPNGPTTQPASSSLPAPPSDPAKVDRARRLYAQGTWHRRRGHYADAMERYLEALALDGSLLEARTDLAGVLVKQGRYGEAIEQYQQVLRFDASRPAALEGLALAYAARREYPAAREQLERLLLLDEGNARAWLELGDVVYQMGDRFGARSHWHKAATVNPDEVEIVMNAKNRLSLFTPTLGKADTSEDRR